MCCDMGRFFIGSGVSSEVYHMIGEVYSYLSTKMMTFPDPSNAKVPALCLVNTINKGVQRRPHEDLWALGQYTNLSLDHRSQHGPRVRSQARV